MNAGLPQLKLWMRGAFRMEAMDEARTSRSGPNRSLEAGFAVARALVVLSIPLAAERTGGTAAVLMSSHPVVALYSLYVAALIFLFVTIERKPPVSVLVAVHVGDILWTCVLAASMDSVGPVVLLLVFPMLTATLRWGASATLATTLGLVAALQAAVGPTLPGAAITAYLAPFQNYAWVIVLGVLFAHVGQGHRRSVNATAMPSAQPLPSGTPAQIIQSIVDQASGTFRPKYIQLVIEEVGTGRNFVWHAERKRESMGIVHSEEFDQARAESYLRLMPAGEWVLSRAETPASLVSVVDGKTRVQRKNIATAFSDYFSRYATVVSALIHMSDEWQGRLIICDPSVQQSHRAALDALRKFIAENSRSIHTAHLCLRACRATAAEERARLARELHDGVIQSLLGVDLRLESMKRQDGLLSDCLDDIHEVQSILRTEAMGLRNLVNDSRRKALSPESLLKYLSDLLERFQADSGFVTHFFADLDDEPMPPRICHEIARIVHEAVTNAQKHSGGSTLIVRIGSVGENWLVLIIDDGMGFPFRGTWPLEKLVSARIGPRVIQDRVQLLGGDLLIESMPTGARIEINIPKTTNSCRELLQHDRALMPA
jgi:signal transduction histidine kinase